MLIVGQSLECWRPPLADAVARRDAAPLIARGRRQVRSGAGAIDVNFGATRRAGLADDLGWAADVVRAALPEVVLFLDCGDLEALGRAVEATAGPVVANAVPLHELTPDAWRLVEAAARAGAGVVVSPRAADRHEDDRAILDAAESAQQLAADAGLRGPVYLDCLTYPPASDLERCRRSLRWIAALRESGPTGVAPLVAIGNLGHGASREERHAWQMTYVTIARKAGAGAMILPVEEGELMSLVRVLDGAASAHTSFEEWAVESCTGGGDVPPPGERLRSAWELLRGP